MKKTGILKIAIGIIGFVILLVCIFWLPKEVATMVQFNQSDHYLKIPILIGIYLTTLPFYFALFQGLKLIDYIEKQTAFSELGIKTLKRIEQCGFVIAFLYGISLFSLGFQNVLESWIMIIGGIIIFASIAIAIFSEVLQELLKMALEIKSENDLTV